MAVLTPQQRNTLESAVKQARKMAEAGAFNALHGLAVDNNIPFEHMSKEQKTLRKSLQIKAKLLGDDLSTNMIDHLTYELAYETWHKMLFANFLEANGLLMHPDGVGVTMEDCEELSKEEGFVDKWDAAANYASKMLPAIFRTDDPLMQVAYATDERIKLEEIIDALENQIFIADDALGWVYQFWQSEAKAAINASGDKIDGEKLPAVTQLFTEPYMVHFLIDNTLGAWWVSRNPGVKPPVKFDYLRLLEDGTPAAGKFEGWPDKTAGIISLDPCMGSGHFVASLFPVFAALRMHEEGLSKEQATDKVIVENLHGLELDARCTQIAAFNLALTAWKFCGHFKELPEMNLACSGIAPKGKVENWVKLVAKEADLAKKQRLENGMKMMYQHFQLAPELGSLLDPTSIQGDPLFTASFEELQPVLKIALESEPDTEQLERGIMAAGIAKAGKLLSLNFHLIITNVPYLGKGKMDDILSAHVENYFKSSKSDLATVFIDRFLNKCLTIAVVSPQNWAFQHSYKKFRKLIISSFSLCAFVKLGEHAFQSPQAAGAFVGLFIINYKQEKDNYFGMDLAEYNSPSLKENKIISSDVILTKKSVVLLDSDLRFIFGDKSNTNPLSMYASSVEGLSTGDKNMFVLMYWELNRLSSDWNYFQVSPTTEESYSGLNCIIKWEGGIGSLSKSEQARVQGFEAWGKIGVLVNLMRDLNSSFYNGQIFDKITAAIIPNKAEYYSSIWCYVRSRDYYKEVRKLNPALQPGTATLIKVPFDLEYWQKEAAEKYPNGLPKPNSHDPTQWLFHGHPIKAENPLQVALARVLGYRWPAESDTEMELAEEARELINVIKEFDYLSDEDGIFCIPSVNAEQAGAERLRDYLQQVFAGDWNNQAITQLLQKEGATSSNLEDWLRKEFFIQHCKVFQNRPFIWHIWDGRNDGFSALVNYHKLDKENLSKLIYTYLGDWIRMCEAKKKAGESGAEGLLSAAQKLKENLEAILQGEAPYDIFVRWKPLEQQPIGWEPDLNDGVRLNIRPFMEADVLRKKPNIKWGVDRGKNPPGTSWGELRDNDKHLSLEIKQTAREKVSKHGK